MIARYLFGRKNQVPEGGPTLEEYIADQFEAIRPMMAHLESALTDLDSLGTLIRERGSARQPMWAHHHSYLRERLQDIRIILGRIVEAKREYAHIEAERASRGDDGGTLDPRLMSLPLQMKLDFESLYIFANHALDQWAMLVGAITGDPIGGPPSFHGFVEAVQSTGYAGQLLPLWERHRRDIIWLYYHVRRVRNRFVEHLRVPLQRSQTLTFYGPDFDLFMPTPLQDGKVPSIGDAGENAIRELGRKYVTHVPTDEWNGYGFQYVLLLVFNSIDALERSAERERVWDACESLGVHVPSYHVIGLRLARFLDESLRTVAETVRAHPPEVTTEQKPGP